MLINVKMQTIFGILIFMSRINFELSRVEHEKSCINSGPGTLLLIIAPCISVKALEWSQHSPIISIWGFFFKHSGAANSLVHGPILPTIGTISTPPV